MSCNKPKCRKAKEKVPIVRWLGLDWYGVPMPIRLLMGRTMSRGLVGCGCVKVLKDWTAKEAAIWNGAFAAMGDGLGL